MNPERSNQFNIFSWSDSIPLCDDLWLGMQARNLAMVDLAILRGMEAEALAAYIERERTPSDILLPLSALSQMWVFALYEFLRTWRERAQGLIDIADKCGGKTEGEREKYLAEQVAKTQKREKYIKYAPSYHSGHVARLGDPKFVKELKDYHAESEGLFRDAEALRVTLAKHEIPKAKFIAEAPGYGRMNYLNGAMYWFLTMKDESQIKVDRRDLSNEFFRIDDDPI